MAKSAIPEPAVSRRALILTAGLLWLLVGAGLFLTALSRLRGVTINPYLLVSGGIALGLLKSRFVLSKIAIKNLERIRLLSPHKEKICIFAFQANLSYLLVLVMIALGITIRRLGLPADWLVPLYTLIGIALMHASLRYLSEKTT